MKPKFFILAFFIILLDQLTKIYFRYNSYDIKVASFHFVRNYGASFGMLQGHKFLLISISIFAIFLISYHLMKTPEEEKTLIYGLVFLLAGASGNLIDRIFFGYVTDFIDALFFPFVFNIADISNSIGAFLILISVFHPKSEAPNRGNPYMKF